jgi:hypothetical protein
MCNQNNVMGCGVGSEIASVNRILAIEPNGIVPIKWPAQKLNIFMTATMFIVDGW